MIRHFIDCREFPSEAQCTLAMSADGEAELLDAAAQHAVRVHGHKDGPQLRAQLKHCVHEGEMVG